MKTDEHAMLQAYIDCHGADIRNWPEELQAWGSRMNATMEGSAMFAREAAFEALLGSGAAIPAMPHGLPSRIISAARARAHYASPFAPLRSITALRPQALAAMLVLGFAIGYSTITTPHAPMMRMSIEDEGAIP